MKKIKALLVSSIFIGLSGLWLFSLKNGAAEEFQGTYKGFGIEPPQLTSALFDHIDYWWLIFFATAVASYLAIILGNNKTGIWGAVFVLAAITALVYIPIIAIGNPV